MKFPSFSKIYTAIKAEFKPEVAKNIEKALPTGDVAWSETSVLYGEGTFEKYNPDSLIGRKGFTIYRKMMMDEQVKAVVKFKRDAVTSRDYTFEIDAKSHKISEAEAARRIDIAYATINNMKGNWMDSLNGIMSAMYQGFSMTEKIFQLFKHLDKQYWGVKELKLKPYDTFIFKVDEYGNVTGLVQKISNKEHALDLDKFIHYVINPDVDEHYGQSELREAYRAWFSKDAIIKFRNIYLERHAGGFRYAQIKDNVTINTTSPEYLALQNVMNSISSSAGVIMPSVAKLETSYPNANVAFKEAIDDQDTAISRALLVPNLLGVSPQGKVGSYSQSTNQLEAFLWTLEADASRLEDTINEQLFRQLGEQNFGDDAWPRFKFNPVSLAKKLEIITKWTDLVTAGAVKSSEFDEDYLRDLLEFPERVADKGKTAQSTDPSTALNGSQVLAMIDVVSRVGTGEIPKESAIEILIAAFPVDRVTAELLVKNVVVKEPSKQPISNQPPNPGGNPNVDPPKNKPADSQSGNGSNQPASASQPTDSTGASNNSVKDETIVGNALISVSAFTQAKSRVAFAVIESTANTIVDEYVPKVAHVMDTIVKQLIEKGKQGKIGEEKITDLTSSVKALTVESKLKAKLNKSIFNLLQDSHALGTRHAQNEIDAAMGESYSRKYDIERFNFIADDFFKIRSFKVAGNLSEQAVEIISNIIINGSKYDWTWIEMEDEIYSTFSKIGAISRELAVDMLGDALDVTDPSSLLRTLVRTNTFDAINTARYDYFTDPGLKGFVQAFEYSAVLDSRTTKVCKHLDEDNTGDHSVAWYEAHPEYKPPNHYNCRSLLIPVTKYDMKNFKEGGEPVVQPQVGFGG